MEQVLARRVANALYPDAQPTAWAAALGGWGAQLVRRWFGGLWVGGTVILTPHQLRFEPNSMNAAMHIGAPAFSIPLAAIRSVRVEWGVVTDIIVLRLENAERRIRCMKAHALADAIDLAVG